MKITKNDYLKLKTAIEVVLKDHPELPKMYKERNLSGMRFRWDMLWRSTFKTTSLYHYLNDDHIDTALRKITGTE